MKKNYIDLIYFRNLLKYPIYVNKVYIVISPNFFGGRGGVIIPSIYKLKGIKKQTKLIYLKYGTPKPRMIKVTNSSQT